MSFNKIIIPTCLLPFVTLADQLGAANQAVAANAQAQAPSGNPSPVLPAAIIGGAQNAQMLDAVERLRNAYNIPQTDVNFQQIMGQIQSGVVGAPNPAQPAAPVVAPSNSILDPAHNNAENLVGHNGDGNWLHNLWGHSAPKTPAELAYDVAHPVEWGDAIAHDTWHNATHFRILNLLSTFFFFFMMYLVCGSCYRYKAYGSRGIDVIPHLPVWMMVCSKSSDVLVSTTSFISSKAGVPRPNMSMVSKKTEYEDFGL